MLFSGVKVLAFAFAFAGSVLAHPIQLQKRDQKIIIGYRSVSPEQGKRYNEAGTLTNDGNRIGTQIGSGVYTTPGPGDWPGGPKDWHCVILADKEAVERVSKAWVPQRDGDKELWFKGDDVINKYIKKLESSWNPAKTIRMSIIDGRGYNDVQLVIPPALLNSSGGGMGIVARCAADIKDIPSARVNYDDWEENIKGDRQ